MIGRPTPGLGEIMAEHEPQTECLLRFQALELSQLSLGPKVDRIYEVVCGNGTPGMDELLRQHLLQHQRGWSTTKKVFAAIAAAGVLASIAIGIIGLAN